MGKSDLAKPNLSGSKPGLAKEPPTKAAASRNLLSLEDVADRLRVDARHVEVWLKDGILKGSVQGIQLYELEKFRAKHHKDIQQAQNAPPPVSARSSKQQKSQGKKPEPVKKAPEVKEKSSGTNPFSLVAAAIKSVVASLGLNRPPKPEKVAPYVRPADFDDDDPFANTPSSQPTMIHRPVSAEPEPVFSANAMATANIPAAAFQAAVATGEL
ncbi:helix-turn-helix domain-containing protein, partial [bacterium]|nr:helix-turn-helix domain-containing protein [bacterium]